MKTRVQSKAYDTFKAKYKNIAKLLNLFLIPLFFLNGNFYLNQEVVGIHTHTEEKLEKIIREISFIEETSLEQSSHKLVTENFIVGNPD